jgi:hypothetical protein
MVAACNSFMAEICVKGEDIHIYNDLDPIS